jgi:hypothetical protein
MKKHNKTSNNSNNRNDRTKPAMPKTAKKGLRLYAAAVLAAAILMSVSGITAFAATTGGNDPIQMVNNLSDFIFGLIRAIGMILIGFGVVQVGLSLKSHDPSQRANGFMTLAGGIIIMLAKEILALIVG